MKEVTGHLKQLLSLLETLKNLTRENNSKYSTLKKMLFEKRELFQKALDIARIVEITDDLTAYVSNPDSNTINMESVLECINTKLEFFKSFKSVKNFLVFREAFETSNVVSNMVTSLFPLILLQNPLNIRNPSNNDLPFIQLYRSIQLYRNCTVHPGAPLMLRPQTPIT